MNSRSGEVVIGLLVGLAIGAAMLYVHSGQYAQATADREGRDVHMSEYFSAEPGASILTLAAPAAGGAAVGWVLDELSGNNKSSSRDNNINVNVEEGDVNIDVSGDSDNDSDNDVNNDNSNNDNSSTETP